jgi:hypothetical protein
VTDNHSNHEDSRTKETIADCLHSPACTDAEVHSALLRIGVPGARTSKGMTNQQIGAWLRRWAFNIPPAAQDELESLLQPDETSAPPTVYTSLFHPNQLQALIQALPIRDGYTQWGRLHGMITRWLQTGDPNTATMPSEEPSEGYPGIAHDYEKLRYVLSQVRDHSTDDWAKGIAREAVGPQRELSPIEAASFGKTLARSPRRVEPRRDDPNAPFRWICPKCTTVNGIADEVCLGGSCGTKRPEKASGEQP